MPRQRQRQTSRAKPKGSAVANSNEGTDNKVTKETIVATSVEREEEIDEDDAELESQDGEVNLDKLQTDFMFRGPVALRLLVEEHALNSKLGPAQFMRKIVADHVGYSLQRNPGRGGQTEEEKAAKLKEAQAKAKAERARIKALLDSERKAAGLTTGK